MTKDQCEIIWTFFELIGAIVNADEPHGTDGPMNWDDTGERENDYWAERVYGAR